ncbi:RNase H domain-containing protein [Caerostris extrusa]|uniref:RNase H domain-containing protein n=1 Tax=Caerostris extrusa TaxID=172846 RepID=A0AAV4N641_CAEEX|nr:RNase H domain-containing protein [Caerostris extrusa]
MTRTAQDRTVALKGEMPFKIGLEDGCSLLHKNQFSYVSIITDSRSVLQALENPNNIEDDIYQIKRNIKNFAGEIHLFWIKAHQGFLGNERADELAKEATLLPSINFHLQYNSLFIKKLIKQETLTEWQNKWSTSLKGREVYTLYLEVKTTRIQGDFFINMLITGHGAIASYQARFFNKPTTCNCGHPLEDRRHIVYDCPQWNNVRGLYFPQNHQRAKLELLLHNPKSKAGLKIIMNAKLQASFKQLKTAIMTNNY